MAEPSNAYLVAGGRYHDIDYARVQLLELLGEHERVRTQVASSYADRAAIAAADFLVTYTCDLRPTPEEQETLAAFVSQGGRWFALHGTNAVLEMMEGFQFEAPRDYPVYMQTLGSQFLAHPAIQAFRVEVSDPSHPLVAGIEPFVTEDELYLCEYHGKLQPLLETRFTGSAPGFVHAEWADDEPRLVMYLHPVDAGEVLYLTLGHCRGKYDMRPLMDEYPTVERCSWELPVFRELVRRGIRWAMRLD